MKLSTTTLVEYRSAGSEDVTAPSEQEALLVPGGTTCCDSGACSSTTCSGAPATAPIK